MDPRIYREDYDFNFCKKAPSIFFGTPLVSFLIRNAIDTVLITGCNTSGCIRAAVTDSFSYGYRTILIEDCCADVDEAAHQSDVRACGRRYCDIATSEDVLTHFEQMGEP
jgi:maleamate amidohydrolase